MSTLGGIIQKSSKKSGRNVQESSKKSGMQFFMSKHGFHTVEDWLMISKTFDLGFPLGEFP